MFLKKISALSGTLWCPLYNLVTNAESVRLHHLPGMEMGVDTPKWKLSFYTHQAVITWKPTFFLSWSLLHISDLSVVNIKCPAWSPLTAGHEEWANSKSTLYIIPRWASVLGSFLLRNKYMKQCRNDKSLHYPVQDHDRSSSLIPYPVIFPLEDPGNRRS